MALNWNFQAATDEEILTVNDAVVTAKIAALRTLTLWNDEAAERLASSKGWHSLVDVVARGALESKWHVVGWLHRYKSAAGRGHHLE